jgi:hypothetical protein
MLKTYFSLKIIIDNLEKDHNNPLKTTLNSGRSSLTKNRTLTTTFESHKKQIHQLQNHPLQP